MANSTRSRSAERLVDILVELHLNGTVNRSALMEKFKITERTVYRDLNALSPIVEHTGNGLYRLIHSAQSPGLQGLQHPISNELNTDKLSTDKSPTPRQGRETPVESYPVNIPGNNAHLLVQSDIHRYLPKIEKSIKNRNVCQIVYKNKSRLINPYKLININNIGYLHATEGGRLKSFSLHQISWLDIQKTTFIPEDNALERLEAHPASWIPEDTFEVKIFINSNISHHFRQRDLLPEQELLGEQDGGIVIRCQAEHENHILPLLFYWLPNIQIVEPDWLKAKLVKTLENYLAESAVSLTA